MRQQLVYYNNAIMHENVRASFLELRSLMLGTLGISIDVVESVKDESDIVYELITLYKYKNELPRQGNKTKNEYNEILSDIATRSAEEDLYKAVKTVIENSGPEKFEPVIGPNRQSNRADNEILYSIPNYPLLDPRRSGRVIRIGPKTIINPTILKFMTDCAGRFGFLHYGPFDPTIWYWRGDKSPYIYTPQQTVNYLNSELSYLL